jgi:hypothetical protein
MVASRTSCRGTAVEEGLLEGMEDGSEGFAPVCRRERATGGLASGIDRPGKRTGRGEAGGRAILHIVLRILNIHTRR